MATMIGRPYPRDPNGVPIGGGASITVLNAAVGTDFTPVALPAGASCKSLLVRLRGGGDFDLSDTAEGAAYLTVSGQIALDLAAEGPAVLFHARAQAAGALELLLLD